MGIGVIGAASAAGGLPAGASAKLLDIWSAGFKKYDGTIGAGDYIGEAAFDGCLYNGNNHIATFKKGRIFKFSLNSSSSDISAINYSPSWESLNSVDSYSPGSLPAPINSSIRVVSSDDARQKSIVSNGYSSVFLTTDGGVTYQQLDTTFFSSLDANFSAYSGAVSPNGNYVYVGNNSSTGSFKVSLDGGDTWQNLNLATGSGGPGSGYQNQGNISVQPDNRFIAVLMASTSSSSVAIVWGMGATIEGYGTVDMGYAATTASQTYLVQIPGSTSFKIYRYNGNTYFFNRILFNEIPASSGGGYSKTGSEIGAWHSSQPYQNYIISHQGVMHQTYRPTGDSASAYLTYLYNSSPTTPGTHTQATIFLPPEMDYRNAYDQNSITWASHLGKVILAYGNSSTYEYSNQFHLMPSSAISYIYENIIDNSFAINSGCEPDVTDAYLQSRSSSRKYVATLVDGSVYFASNNWKSVPSPLSIYEAE